MRYFAMEAYRTAQAKVSIPAILAVICVIISFATGAMLGFIFALLAMFFALIGIVISLSPHVRGGLISMLSLMAGGVALVVAAVKAFRWLS